VVPSGVSGALRAKGQAVLKRCQKPADVLMKETRVVSVCGLRSCVCFWGVSVGWNDKGMFERWLGRDSDDGEVEVQVLPQLKGQRRPARV